MKPESRAVLVIDNDPHGAGNLKSHLVGAGYRAYATESLDEALKIAQEKKVAVALLALGRPGLEPGRLIKHLQGSKDVDRVPVIVILETFAEDLVAAALKAGAADYLVRPLDFKELIRRVGVHARLEEDKQAMAESMDRYEKHFGTADVGLFFTSKSGELIECNEALVKMLGYERKDDLLRRNVEETIYVNPEERRKFKRAVEEKGVVKEFRVTFRKKGGDPLPIVISGRVVRDDNWQAAGFVAADNLSPQKAWVLLTLGLAVTSDPDRIQSMFDKY